MIKNSSTSSTLNTFGRAQTAALLATALDFTVYTLLIELFAVWYVAAAVVGAICGAICNFMLGRNWCFVASDGHITLQGFRYTVVASGSLILNTGGIYLLTDFLGMHYLLSKTLIAILIAVAFNYPLQRYYVFIK